jgi:excinuclease ABC subunit A
MALPERTRFQILAPVVRGKKGTHKKLLSALRRRGLCGCALTAKFAS